MLLITGASGHIGRRVAELLGGRGAELRLATRTPARAPRLPQVQVVAADFDDPASLAVAFAGVDAALVISGSAPPGERAEQHRRAFHAAAAAHVRHVVYLSLQGTRPQSRFSYSRDHDTSEGYLRAAGIPGFTILRNAFYFDMLPVLLDANGVLHDPAGRGRAAFIAREDAARAAASALLRCPGGTWDVTGPESISVAEAIRRLAGLTGRALRCEASVPPAPTAVPADWRATLYTGWFEAIAAGELDHATDAVRRLTGRNPMNLEEYFHAFPGALTPRRQR